MAEKKRENSIKRVVYNPTGQVLDVSYLDKTKDGVLLHIRREIADDIHLNSKAESRLFVCGHCSQPVVLRGGSVRTAHFAHLRKSGECIYKTDIYDKADVKASKHEGIHEGERHFNLKHDIASYLMTDPFFKADTVQVEKRINSLSGNAYRVPDVNAIDCNGARYAFELQLSTTSIKDIVMRESFYKNEGIFLIWVFDSFKPNNATTSDCHYAAFNHVYVFDEVARDRSEKTGQLYLTCHFPSNNESDAGHRQRSYWDSRLITVSELSLCHQSVRPYLMRVSQQAFSTLSFVQELSCEQITDLMADAILFDKRDEYIKLSGMDELHI